MGHKTNTSAPAAAMRRDRLIKERIHDPYHVRHRPSEGTTCPDCGLVFKNGTWSANAGGDAAAATTCPACQRVRDRLPAGTLTLSGGFLAAHREEILSLARHAAEREGRRHPLHRIMEIEDAGHGTVITTTDIHLPRTIGQALQRAYSGDLKITYGDEAYSVRVEWSRAS